MAVRRKVGRDGAAIGELPVSGAVRWAGPSDNERAIYKLSKTRRELIGLDHPLQFTLHARDDSAPT